MLRKAVSVDDAAHRFDPSGTANKSVSCGYPERVRMGECHGRNSKQRVSLCGGQGFGFGTAVGGRGQFVRVCRQAVRAPTVTETKKITGQKNEAGGDPKRKARQVAAPRTNRVCQERKKDSGVMLRRRDG